MVSLLEAIRSEVDRAVAENPTRGMAVATVVDGARLVVTGGQCGAGGEAVTDQTAFRLGSVTKVLTATLVMRLVENGAVGLDDMIAAHIPSLRVNRGEHPQIAVRHLLAKSDGISDHVEGFGVDDDCVARYVESLSEVPLLFPPGEMWSYANTGSIVLARLIEAKTGLSYDEALRARLVEPLGMERTFHLTNHDDTTDPKPGVAQRPVGDWPPALNEPRAMAACGTTLATSITDLATFAEAHLRDGLLNTSTRQEMQRIQASVPELGLGGGLGWSIDDRPPLACYHGGGSRPAGSWSYLRLVPDHALGIAVLANWPTAVTTTNRLVAAAEAAVGIADRPQREPPHREGDAALASGTYRRGHATFTVASDKDTDAITVTRSPGPLGDHDSRPRGTREYRLTNGWFLGPDGWIAFLRPGVDGFSFLHDGRAAPRL